MLDSRTQAKGPAKSEWMIFAIIIYLMGLTKSSPLQIDITSFHHHRLTHSKWGPRRLRFKPLMNRS